MSLQRVTFSMESAAGGWLHVLPFGPFVVARDGRAFQVKDARRVAAASEKPVLVDWEHESEQWNGSTKAAGWGEELYVEDGTSGKFSTPGIWMRVEWTPDGETDVKNKSYLFLSPVLVLDGEERDVLEIVSVALTNRPALRMEQIGKYREEQYLSQVRMACSLRGKRTDAPSHASFSEQERVELRNKGWSDDEIRKVESHKARLYQHAPMRGFQAMTSAERAQHLRSGWSQTEIESVEAHRRRMYEPERGDADVLQSSSPRDWVGGAFAKLETLKRERGIE